MFDNLRDEAASTSYYEEDVAKFQPAAGTDAGTSSAGRPSRFLGMSSGQRFIIAIMLLMGVCLIGAMCLLATNKIGF